MKHTRRQQGKEAFDLIEESVHLLRTAPVATLAVYCLGTVPFVLGLLFFWADMSRNPFANQHLADGSFAMAILFVWMKFWQVIFTRRLRAQAAVEAPLPLNFRRGARTVLTQMILQPPGLFLIPLSLISVLPFAWIFTFYQNATVLADGQEKTSGLFKKSCRQAALWPKQNNLALAILLAFAFFVFLNWTTVCLVLPQLLKMLFGVQSMFTQSPWSMLNTTFFAAMFGLTFLCVDPILKAYFTLRCFYGESLKSGEDLKAVLKPFVASARGTMVSLLFALAVFASLPVMAADSASPAAPKSAQQISPPDLDKAINETIHQRKYTWRMPREKTVEDKQNEGLISKFFSQIGDTLHKWVRAVLDRLDKWLQKLFHRKHTVSVSADSSGYGWIMSVEILLWGLVAVVLAALLIFLYRVWRGRQKARTAVVGEAILSTPDLADENVSADQLPEDSWTRLARELLERGEFRLAMRAFYLSSLAHLAGRNLITIARFKSNRDYERELRRRGHSFPDLPAVFGDNLSVFERIWYGMHEINRELVDRFVSNVERIKGAG